MEHPIKMDDLGVPLFLETPIFDLCMILSISISTSPPFSSKDTSSFRSHQVSRVSHQVGPNDISFQASVLSSEPSKTIG